MRIVHDETKCTSIGMCESLAPHIFEIGDDGYLTVLNATPPAEERGLIEEACAACPTGALTLLDS